MRDWLAIAAGAACGYAFVRLMQGRPLLSNPDWKLVWEEDDDEDQEYAEVVVGGDVIGTVIKGTGRRGDPPWLGSTEDPALKMQAKGFKSAEDAAKAIFRVWDRGRKKALEAAFAEMMGETPAKKERKPRAKPAPVQAPPFIVADKPDYLPEGEVELWPIESGFRVVLRGQTIGVIDKRGRTHDAYLFTERGKLLLKMGTSRPGAVGAIYTAHSILDFLSKSVSFGRLMPVTALPGVRGGEQQADPRWITLPPKKRGQRKRVKRRMTRKRHYDIVEVHAIVRAIGAPQKSIEEYAKLLAEKNLIYGVRVRETQRLTTAVKKGSRGRRVMTVQKKKRASSRYVYRFGMRGPGGEVGWYGDIDSLPTRKEAGLLTKDEMEQEREVAELKKFEEKWG